MKWTRGFSGGDPLHIYIEASSSSGVASREVSIVDGHLELAGVDLLPSLGLGQGLTHGSIGANAAPSTAASRVLALVSAPPHAFFSAFLASLASDLVVLRMMGASIPDKPRLDSRK